MTRAIVDCQGKVLAIGGFWGDVSTATAAHDIERGRCRYYVTLPTGAVPVRVEYGDRGRELAAGRLEIGRNVLRDLA